MNTAPKVINRLAACERRQARLAGKCASNERLCKIVCNSLAITLTRLRVAYSSIGNGEFDAAFVTKFNSVRSAVLVLDSTAGVPAEIV